MTDPTARSLRLLSLLQTHRFWPGRELAERLGVSERTLRRDVDRLRDLGYRVSSGPGIAGGYQLEAGSALPPLLLDDDEAVAIAVGLRIAALHGLDDGERTSLSALAKLEQVLPSRLRRRVSALQEHTSPVVWGERPRVGTEVLARLALACRDRESLRFRYTARDGAETSRLVEPHSLVPHGARWYLVAWDAGREDWRTFRIDRLSALVATGVRVSPRELPAPDAAAFVRSRRSDSRPRHEAVIRLDMDRVAFEAQMGRWARGATDGPGGTADWPARGHSPQEVLAYLLWLPEGVDWELITEDEAVLAAVAAFRDRLSSAGR